MRTYFQTASLITLLLLQTGLKAETVESFRLETHAYVFKNSDFHSVTIPGSTATGQTLAAMFRSPATAQFDRETLALDGGRFAWNGGQTPPDRFSQITIPAVVLVPGKPVSLLSVVPVQYFEKDANGTLQVREIPGDSPDAPHWRLTFTLKTRAEIGDDLSLACEVDVASVSTRESLPGVTLAVGKPVLARFNEKLDLKVLPDEWSAFVVRAPNESDYSLLTLLKIGPEPKPGETAKSNRLMTAQEFAQFATYYYQHPQPELITQAIESLGPSKFLDTGNRNSNRYDPRGDTCVGFFAAVFAANPERVAEWRKVIDQGGLDGRTRSWMRKALKLSRPGLIREPELAPNDFDALGTSYTLWGAFFASGNPAYLKKVVNLLRFEDERLFYAGANAMVSLAYNAPHHPLVHETLLAARAEEGPSTRELIDHLLNKDLEAIRQEARNMRLSFTYNSHGGNSDSLTTNPWGILPPSDPPPNFAPGPSR